MINRPRRDDADEPARGDTQAGTNKAFPRPSHCPEDAPPSDSVIATGGTTRRPGVFREFLNGN